MTRDLLGWFFFIGNLAVAWWRWPHDPAWLNLFIAGWLFDGRIDCLGRWWSEIEREEPGR